MEAALDPGDLNQRLGRALARALGGVEQGLEGDLGACFERLAQEEEPVYQARLRRAFENAWKLGQSAQLRFGPLLSTQAWASLLERLSSLVCTAGRWSAGPEGSWEIVRSPCPSFEKYGWFACDFYREAADGLVCGMGAGVRFAKLASPTRGGSGCWSRIFSRERPELGWREASCAEREQLDHAIEELSRRGVQLQVLGLLEDRVIYRMTPIPEGGGRIPPLAEALVENVFSHVTAGLRPLSAQPRPVLANFG